MENLQKTDIDTAEINKVLITPRLNILDNLKNGPKTTGNLKDAIETRDWHLTRYHLKILETYGYIQKEKKEFNTKNGGKISTTLFNITSKGFQSLRFFGRL